MREGGVELFCVAKDASEKSANHAEKMAESGFYFCFVRIGFGLSFLRIFWTLFHGWILLKSSKWPKILWRTLEWVFLWRVWGRFLESVRQVRLVLGRSGL